MSMLLGSPAAEPVSRARLAQRSGRLEEARRLFAEAMKAAPRDGELLVEAAVIEAQLGSLKTAERLLNKALKIEPRNADAYYNLGQIAREEDTLERAARLFRKTLELDPEHGDAAFALGEALYVQGKAEEALPWLDRALAASPRDAEILHVKAIALDHLGRTPDAFAAYREVLRIDPAHVNASLNMAVLAARAGDPAEALQCIDRLEAGPGIASHGAATAAKVLNLVGENDRALAYVEQATAAQSRVNDAMNTRANILIDAGQFDAAEAILRKLVTAKKDPAHALYRLAVINRLAPEAEEILAERAGDRSLPAASRSAAQFALYHLLDRQGRYEEAFERLAQANVLKGGAVQFDVNRHVSQTARLMDVFTPEHVAARLPHGFEASGAIFVVGMPRSGTTLTEQILAAHPAVYGGGESLTLSRIITRFKGWPEHALTADASSVNEQGKAIHEATFAPAKGKPFATDKTPGNFMLLGALHSSLPQAKLVYVRREPGDNALSLYEQSFLRGLGYSYDLAKIGIVYREHLRLMNHWLNVCRLPIHTVHYDALVQDPEPHIRALLDFVGLEFHAGCLTPERVERPIKTSSVWQVRQPISAKSVGRWRRYERQMQPFVRALEGAP
jgi:tetratricopeptide (TPR) repeat protein